MNCFSVRDLTSLSTVISSSNSPCSSFVNLKISKLVLLIISETLFFKKLKLISSNSIVFIFLSLIFNIIDLTNIKVICVVIKN
jgi:hypothetical protein